MSFHKIGSYHRPATGGKCNGGADKCVSPQIVASLDPDDFNRLARLAHDKALPIAALVRRAVAAWLRSINESAAKDS